MQPQPKRQEGDNEGRSLFQLVSRESHSLYSCSWLRSPMGAGHDYCWADSYSRRVTLVTLGGHRHRLQQQMLRDTNRPPSGGPSTMPAMQMLVWSVQQSWQRKRICLPSPWHSKVLPCSHPEHMRTANWKQLLEHTPVLHHPPHWLL